jgi:hypothetical protein
VRFASKPIGKPQRHRELPARSIHSNTGDMHMSKIGSEIKPYLRILLALAWLFTSSAVAAADGCAPDEAVDTLSIPGRWRGFSTAAEEWLRFEVAAPAILTLDATAPLTALGDPVLTVLGPGCQTVTEDFTYLERSSSRRPASTSCG